MKNILIALFLLSSACFCDVLSTNGKIRFDIQMDGQPEMTLNSTGLAIGALLPSSNLHVNGNAIISEQLFVGGSSGSSNLNVTGTIGFGFQTVTSSTTLSGNSIVLVDSSAGNITLSLPEASSYSGRKYTIKKTSPLNRISIRDGGFIDNYSDVSLSVNNMGSLSVISNSGNWHILNISGSGTSVASDNLVSWWKMDEANGVVAFDSSLLGNEGALGASMSFSGNGTSGIINRSLVFDGIDDYIEVPDNDNLTPNHITVSAWIKTDAFSHLIDIISKRNSSNIGGFVWETSGAGGVVIMYHYITGSWQSVSVTIPNSQWALVTSTYDGETIKGYINGVLKSSNATPSGPLNNDSGFLRIGANTASLNRFFKSQIDDVRVYNRALTANEIQALYNQGQ
jgi:hypothetical protein